MASPPKASYRLSNLHVNLFRNVYLISTDGSLFFKASSMQELRIYRQLAMAHSQLLSFVPSLVGIYKCKEDALDLIMDLSGDLCSVDFGALESLLAMATKCRTFNCHEPIFTALKNLHNSNDTHSKIYFMDLKLGFITFPLGAQQSKIRSQEAKARDTTTSTHGVRLMGAVLPARSRTSTTESVLLTKTEGRACSYDDILAHLCTLFPDRRSLGQLVARLQALSASLLGECLHMCGPSLLISSTHQGQIDNHASHNALPSVFLVDFAHTYTRDQAVALCTDRHILSTTASTTIAACIESLSHNLQVYHAF
ncbi:Inositol polyphosphate kinase [Giardia duodenalis]|uniref:Kinase n=1 Tax=Giardia intestinalis TaxID=5741 RepID=A8W2C7_GIAIN|nr:inositol hexakisphosphate kinase [Giardia intestinalis]ABW38752.1 inositol hexakisphosphate kinase [Giardia intestinalis]ABW38776.1 inositol hexakisphosphate kinase [Giardia intestinalis]ESU39289.1 Inositol polyphosphate kinase [Giardia intestinalis]